MNNLRVEYSLSLKLSLLFLFLLILIMPVTSMIYDLNFDELKSLLKSPMFSKALTNSISISSLATFISLFMGLMLSCCVYRTGIKFKSAVCAILVLPMLIPSISHGFGLVVLLGANGLITNLLNSNSNIYGFWGIVIGSVMYSFPVAFLMISDVLRYEDSTPYDAAQVLGIPKIRQFSSLTLPYLAKPMILVAFSTFTMIITDYGVPLMIGAKTITLPVLMYNEAVGMLNYEKAKIIGMFLLVPALVAFLIDLSTPINSNNTYLNKNFEIRKNIITEYLSYFICIITILCITIPIFSFCILTFQTKYPINTTFTMYNITKTFARGAGTFLYNSIIIAFFVSSVGTLLSLATAYFTARTSGRLSKALHLMSMTSIAVPGIVLGLSYVFMFNSSWIYGTVIIVILVNTIHFFASPYLIIYNSLNKLNSNLEAVGATLGINRFRMLINVFIPQIKASLIESFVYFFVNSMMTISAVSFLAPPAPKPVALLITQFESQLLMESAAFISLLILCVNIIAKCCAYIFRYFLSNETILTHKVNNDY